jgi:hypothetical protein
MPVIKPKGYVLWRGLSPINRQPVVAIMTMESANRKTGNMAQVWILCENGDPVDNVQDGGDVTICGNCPHRKNSMGVRTCYVNVGQAPLAVYRSWKAGKYPHIRLHYDAVTKALSSRKIRWGAYGDPAILPSSLVTDLNVHSLGWTGYTHQWQQPYAAAYRGILMASCDSVTDHDKAKAMGWATFTVAAVNAKVTHAKQCPATVAGSQAQCITCTLCDGARSDIFVHAHGPSRKAVTYA